MYERTPEEVGRLMNEIAYHEAEYAYSHAAAGIYSRLSRTN